MGVWSWLTGGSAQPRADSVTVIDGGFRAARSGPASSAFETERKSINGAILAGGNTLRARSRFHTRENPLLIGAKDTWSAYAIGTGMAPTWPDLKPTVRKALMKAFNAWAKKCDFDARTNFYGLQAIVGEEGFEAGECFIRLNTSPTRPLRLQLITSEQLPYNVSTVPTSEGNTIRLGIEFDANGVRVAYWFTKAHPGDATIQSFDSSMLVRVPAEQVLHVYRVEQPGQIRGVPRTRGALIPANKLNEYDDSTLERANVASKFAVAITRADDEESPFAEQANAIALRAMEVAAEKGQAPPSQPTVDLVPGTMMEMNPGEEVKTIDPPDPGNNYDLFRYAQQTRGCAAMGVPYTETTGDVKAANFSSVRTGRQPFKRKVEQFQQLTLVPQMLDPVMEAWLADGLLRGTISLPRGAARTVDAYSNVDWVPPVWEYVNPKDEAEADILLQDALIKPRSRNITERGGDAEEVDEVIAEDQKREKRLGIQRVVKPASTPPPPAKSEPAAPADPGAPTP